MTNPIESKDKSREELLEEARKNANSPLLQTEDEVDEAWAKYFRLLYGSKPETDTASQ